MKLLVDRHAACSDALLQKILIADRHWMMSMLTLTTAGLPGADSKPAHAALCRRMAARFTHTQPLRPCSEPLYAMQTATSSLSPRKVLFYVCQGLCIFPLLHKCMTLAWYYCCLPAYVRVAHIRSRFALIEGSWLQARCTSPLSLAA